MTAEGILEFLKGFQKEHIIWDRGMIHDQRELDIELHDREKAQDVCVRVFILNRKHFHQENPGITKTVPVTNAPWIA